MSSSSTAGGERPSSRNESRADDAKGPAKPDLFYGDRNKLDDWFNQLGMYYLFNRTPIEHRTMFAVTFLRGRAQHYVKPLITQFLDDKTDPKGIFRDFGTFKVYMKEVFGITNEENAAVRVIQSLQQKTSAAEYTARFREYANLTDWKGSALMTMYRRGLKENVKDELMRSGAEHDTLERLITDAIEIDDKLYERAMERRHMRGGRTYALPGRSGGAGRGDPMEIDNIQKGRSKKRGGGKKKSKGLKCWTCGKEGHMSKDCRGKNKVRRQQFNMMQHRNQSPPPDDEFRIKRLQLIMQCINDERDTLLQAEPWTEESSRQFDGLQTAGEHVRRCHDHFQWAQAVGPTAEPNQLVDNLEDLDLGQPEPATRSVEGRPNTPEIQRKPQRTKPSKQAGKRKQEQPKKATNHASMSWTACYDDQCRVHLSEKQGSGWYPTKPRRQLNMMQTRPKLERQDATISPPEEIKGAEALMALGEDPRHQEEPEPIGSPHVSETQDSEPGGTDGTASESDSDGDVSDYDLEDPDYEELIYFAIEAPGPIRKLINYIAQNYELAFPKIGGKRHLDPFHFEMLIDSMRAQFAHHRRVQTGTDLGESIRERPPFGSIFQPDGSYVTTDGIVVKQAMREEVRNVRTLYRAVQDIQQQVMNHELDMVDAKQQLQDTSWAYHERHSLPSGPLPRWKGQMQSQHMMSVKGHVHITFMGQQTLEFGKRVDSPSRSACGELLNTTAPASGHTVFRTYCIVEGRRTMAMIDSGATGNFMATRFVKRHGIATREKHEGYELIAVDGSSLPDVDSETIPLPLALQRHHEEITLDVTDMASHDVVLGMPWLRKHNPIIDWRRGVLRFEQCDCVIDIEPTRGRRFAADEVREFNLMRDSPPIQEPSEMESLSPATQRGQRGQQGRKQEGSNAPPNIPREYRKWMRLFEEEDGKEALPKHRPWDHEIKLEPGKQPTFGPIYAQSEKELRTLREYLDENLARGFIEKSESPAGYPITFVPKKDGKLRLCVDYRKLNDITIKNRYPLPNIEELQHRLQGAQWFTTIDLRGAYNLIRIKKGEEWKTAFRCRYGHYQYKVMPFGLTNAPATCQMMINDTLREYLDNFVVAYLDDILVYTTGTLKDHIAHVSKVLDKLKDRELKIKPEKCDFHKTSVTFLGFIVGRQGIQLDPSKVDSIRTWPTPKTVKDVQAFLGLTNYNRKFVENYSKLALPLTELTKKDKPFTWAKPQQAAFEALKRANEDSPVLRMFTPTQALHIETDASDRAIGACATQFFNGKRHPIAYYSRKMSPAEENYDIHDKELLAVVSALQHWRVYCEGAPELTVYTDHKNLLHFTTTKQLNRRQTRWSELLGQYKFTIKYTPGKDNARADALSRRSDYMEGHQPTSHSILKVNADGTLSANPQEFNTILRILTDDSEQFPIEHGKYKVPQDKEQQCISDHHDGPSNGHPGIAKTTERIQRNFTFPDMRNKISTYLAKCIECRQNKASRHARFGNLQMIPPPELPWDEVTMDFITDLPATQDPANGTYADSILVMVDRLTKYAHFVPTTKSVTAEALGHVVLDRLVRYHGMPKSLITDRDKLFTSAFWKTLTAAMGIKHKLTTAFHPQTDGQTERTNQTLEAYLRHFLNHTQDNWGSLLPMAQLAINNMRSDTTKETPFFANFGKDPLLFNTELPHNNAARALEKTRALRKTHDTIREAIVSSQSKITKSRHNPKKNGPQLKKGDKVYLLTKNLQSRRQNKKLDHVKVGPFLIAEQKGPVNYRLELPRDARIHPVFHISLLEPADPITPLQTTFYFEPQQEDTFEVEKIEKFDGNQYLVKWKGYDESENTWEPPANLRTCMDKLREFHGDPSLETSFRTRFGHWHVDLRTQRSFLQSFPLKEIQGRCIKCSPRPRGRPPKNQ